VVAQIRAVSTASKTTTKYVFLPDLNIVTTLGINIIEKQLISTFYFRECNI
jgi:hypothetical protein